MKLILSNHSTPVIKIIISCIAGLALNTATNALTLRSFHPW